MTERKKVEEKRKQLAAAKTAVEVAELVEALRAAGPRPQVRAKVLTEADMPRNLALPIGAFAGFALRGAAILRGWSMPTYRARPGRDYPDQR